MSNKLGTNFTTFEVKMESNAFRTDDTVLTNGIECLITSEPIRYNYRWYHRLLNILTFGYYWNEKYTYTIETKE